MFTTLREKIDELEKRNCTDAAKAAKAIHEGVNQLFTQYQAGAISEQKFQKESGTILTPTLREELEEFRGWKLKKVGEVLVNLLALIASLGTSYHSLHLNSHCLR